MFLNIPWKWNNLVSLRPNYIIFIGYLKPGRGRGREGVRVNPLNPLTIREISRKPWFSDLNLVQNCSTPVLALCCFTDHKLSDEFIIYVRLLDHLTNGQIENDVYARVSGSSGWPDCIRECEILRTVSACQQNSVGRHVSLWQKVRYTPRLVLW